MTKKLKCRIVLSYLVIACLPAVARAQTTPPAHEAAVDEVFADFVKPGSPGCSVAVAKDGKLLFEKGYGLGNIEQNVRLTPQTVFDIGSTSKQFSAASILLLEKQGKLSVNDEIYKYVPELPDYGKPITILNLLNHTSGLRDYLALFELAGYNVDSVTTDEEALALVARQKALNFDPGTQWYYSNTGFFLLSTIVKRVSGQTLREFAAVNIFGPLQMNNTMFRDSHTLLIPNRALAYDPIEKGKGYTMNVSYFEQTGDGAVHTTVEDLLKWDENFYSGKVGGKEFLAELQLPGKLNSGKTLDYAKGLFVGTYRGLPVVRHGGAWGGYRAELLRFPEQHFSVVTLCNVSNGDPETHADRVADIFLASQLKEKEKPQADPEEKKPRTEVPLSADALKSYAGDYWSEELGVHYRLGADGGKLRFEGIYGAEGVPRSSDWKGASLIPVAVDEFEFEPARFIVFTFQPKDKGAASGFTLGAGRSTGINFVRSAGTKTGDVR